MDWPGHDEPIPIVFNAGRPGRHRTRLNSDHPSRQQAFYVGADGQLLVPAAGAGGWEVCTDLLPCLGKDLLK